MSTLTDSERVNTRRWLGYPPLNSGEPDYVFGHTPSSVSLNDKLDNLTTIEEEALRNQFLTPLAAMETALVGSIDNMDTQEAGPWIANTRETGDRTRLFKQWRREMSAFLGFAPGPSLGTGGAAIVRC